MSATETLIRRYEPGDEAGILALFRKVFGGARPGEAPRTEAEWRWRFLENPAGTRVWVGVEEGAVVSQYASIPVRMTLEGRRATFGQIVDSMVDPSRRGGRLFVRTAEPFFEAFGGPDRDVVMYGYPVPVAWRVGAAFLRYEIVRTETVLFREPPDSPSAAPASLVVEEPARFGAAADDLWEEVAPELAAASVRDARYLDWRYAAAPAHLRYRLALARGPGGEPRGLAVLRVASFLAPRVGVLCDWLVPAEDEEAARALLGWAGARSREAGAPALAAIFPDSSPWFGRFQREGFLVSPTDYFMVGRPFDARYDMEWLRRNWTYTLGDTDLV